VHLEYDQMHILLLHEHQEQQYDHLILVLFQVPRWLLRLDASVQTFPHQRIFGCNALIRHLLLASLNIDDLYC
jgi:hypothetical protein